MMKKPDSTADSFHINHYHCLMCWISRVKRQIPTNAMQPAYLKCFGMLSANLLPRLKRELDGICCSISARVFFVVAASLGCISFGLSDLERESDARV